MVYGILPQICQQRVATLLQVIEHKDIPDGKFLYVNALQRFQIDTFEKNDENNFFQCTFTLFDDINGIKPSASFGTEDETENEEEREDESKIAELQQRVEDMLISDMQADEYEALQLEGTIPASNDWIRYS